jgi:hypothetical protein
MEQIPSPGPSKLFHLRMIASLAFFLFWDVLSTYVCLSSLILDKDAIKRGTALGGLGGSSILFAAEVGPAFFPLIGNHPLHANETACIVVQPSWMISSLSPWLGVSILPRNTSST